MTEDKIHLTKQEVRAIVHWLDVSTNGKFYDGSYRNIELIYFRLAKFCDAPIKRWRWKEEAKGK